ncbi:NAD-dependent protein deacylase, partial [Paracoccus sp. PXZ]
PDPCPACGQALTRPDIVWFGEIPYHMERIWEAVESADLFAAIGTSGLVYPAAGLAQHARRKGAETIELNLAASAVSRDFSDRRTGPATAVVPQWVDALCN